LESLKKLFAFIFRVEVFAGVLEKSIKDGSFDAEEIQSTVNGIFCLPQTFYCRPARAQANLENEKNLKRRLQKLPI
jgi:hypothetical protein